MVHDVRWQPGGSQHVSFDSHCLLLNIHDYVLNLKEIAVKIKNNFLLCNIVISVIF